MRQLPGGPLTLWCGSTLLPFAVALASDAQQRRITLVGSLADVQLGPPVAGDPAMWAEEYRQMMGLPATPPAAA